MDKNNDFAPLVRPKVETTQTIDSPLADRMRPQNLNEFVGQGHLVGEGKILQTIIKKDTIPSMIFWGPPGSGKTTLARIIALETNSQFIQVSAVLIGVKDIRKIVEKAKSGRVRHSEFISESFQGILKPVQDDGNGPVQDDKSNHIDSRLHGNDDGGKKTILFIDEIHRFNKAQQDSLLPHVENGTIILIGATTENPSFEVIGPLLSRTRVFVLNQLTEEDLVVILKRAVQDKERGLGKNKIVIVDEQLRIIARFANGDARTALNILELAVKITPKKSSSSGLTRGSIKYSIDSRSGSGMTRGEKEIVSPDDHRGRNDYTLKITDELLKEAVQKSQLLYDRAGEEHYNTISAFIKSMRASDTDAALYYLARMVEAGEDPLFIARRMVVFASEDVSSPTALVVANAVFQACQQLGFPECQENLAAGVVYLSQAKKDRRSYDAYMQALSDVKKYGNLPIPFEVRNAPTKLMKGLGYGKGYQMYPKDISYLPEKLKGKKYYKRYE